MILELRNKAERKNRLILLAMFLCIIGISFIFFQIDKIISNEDLISMGAFGSISFIKSCLILMYITSGFVIFKYIKFKNKKLKKIQDRIFKKRENLIIGLILIGILLSMSSGINGKGIKESIKYIMFDFNRGRAGRHRSTLKVLIFFIIAIIVAKLTIRQTIKKINNTEKLDKEIGLKTVIKDLGREKMKYPIFLFENGYDTTYVGNTTDLSGLFHVGINPSYIIDSDFRKFETKLIKLEMIGINNPEFSKMKFGRIEDHGEIIDFETLKKSIVKSINKTKNSAYSGLEKEIQNATDIYELTEVMDKGKF